MSRSRPRYTRKDLNHGEIVTQCRALGIVVWDLADLGGKLSDTVMMWRGQILPVEIKQPGKADDLTQGERDGISECCFVGVDWVIATCVEDVLKAFGALDVGAGALAQGRDGDERGRG